MSSGKPDRTQPDPLALPCACANLRRASRAVTRLYNRELRTAGLEATQYTLLMALNGIGETTQGELGRFLALDTTTLTRMLGLLKKNGWIAMRSGDDRRQRLLRLTHAGKQKLVRASRHWEHAQERLRREIGNAAWDQLLGLLAKVTRASVG